MSPDTSRFPIAQQICGRVAHQLDTYGFSPDIDTQTRLKALGLVSRADFLIPNMRRLVIVEQVLVVPSKRLELGPTDMYKVTSNDLSARPETNFQLGLPDNREPKIVFPEDELPRIPTRAEMGTADLHLQWVENFGQLQDPKAWHVVGI